MVARSLLLALLAVLMPAAGYGQTLPPDQPDTPFTAEYRLEREVGGRVQWGKRRIAVAGSLMRDELLDGDLPTATLLADAASDTLLSFEPDDPARIAHRSPIGARLPAMAQGYRLVNARMGEPRLLGERQIAGQSCTRLIWEIPGERQEWCITAQGIALATRRIAGRNDTRLEALSLDLQPPSPAVFDLPAGFTIQGE